MAMALGGLAWAEEIKIIETGPHHMVVEDVRPGVAPDGGTELATNRYTVLATGLSRWDAKAEAYVPAEAVFEELTTGHFVARKTQHQVILPADLSKEPVDFLAPDGLTRMVSRPTGVALLDRSTGRSVLVGELRACQGHLESPTRLVYPSALEGIEADIVFDLSLSGFEQSIVLREQFPSFEAMGWDQATPLEALRVIVMTEFIEAPEPAAEPRLLKEETDEIRLKTWVSPHLLDQELAFGTTWRMVEGKAFALEGGEPVPVGKAWERLEGDRQFLLESCDYLDVAPMIEKLPLQQASIQKPAKYRTAQGGKLQFEGLPRRTEWKEAKVGTSVRLQRLTANGEVPRERQWAAAPRRPGLVLDYSTINGSQTNVVFAADVTFLVTNAVDLYGTTVLEPSVIKFDKLTNGGPTLQVTVHGPLTMKTTASRPACFVAKDDDSVGATISGSTGNPGTQNYAGCALRCVDTSPYTVEHVRFRNAYSALGFANTNTNVVRHAQFVSCYLPLWNSSTGPLFLRNVLLDGTRGYSFQAPSTGTPAWVGEHLTVHNAPVLSRFANLTLTLTNSLIVEVTTPGTYQGVGNFQTNTDAGLFQSVVGGNFYLAANSPHRDAGVAGIDEALRQDFRNLTTFPPLIWTNTIDTNTLWAPQATRDSDTPDRGYHYLPLDYVVSGVTVAASLTLTNGTAVGVRGTYGLGLDSGAVVISEGSPTQPNRFVSLNCVQEQPTNTTGSVVFRLLNPLPSLSLCATEVSLRPGGSGTLLDTTSTATTFEEFELRDSFLRGANLSWEPVTSAETRLGWTNNVFERCALSLQHYHNSEDTPFTVELRNNLFQGGSLALSYGAGAENPYWTTRDNLFHGTTQTASGGAWQTYLRRDHNGFTAGTTNALGGTDNKTNLVADFLAGPLGPYYYPLGGTNLFALVDAGSLTNAAEVGLYEHVTQLSQIPEGNSRLDIGFHYPATAFTNLALGATTAQSSTVWGGVAARAVDGNTDGDYNHFSVTHTLTNGEPYWTVDLGRVQTVSQVRVWNRTDAGSNRLSNFYVFASDTAFQYTNVSATLAQTGVSASYVSGTCGRPTTVGIGRTAQYVRVQLTTNEFLHIAEVQVLGPANAPGDTDGDGIPDYLEDRNGNGTKDAGETDFADADTDYDGRNDGEELAEGTDPLDAASFKPVCLSWFRFNTNTWAGERGQLPYFSTALTNVTGWAGQGVSLSATNSLLCYRPMEADAKANINFRSGALRLHFFPYWYSALPTNDVDYVFGGDGPGHWVRLVEAGSTNGTSGFFALSIDAAGTNLLLQTIPTGGGTLLTHASLPLRLVSDDVRDASTRTSYWWQVAAAWSPTQTWLSVSPLCPQQVSNAYFFHEVTGGGLTNAPQGLRGLPFSVGTAAAGGLAAYGILDEWETYNLPLRSRVANVWAACNAQAGLDALELGWQAPSNSPVDVERRPSLGGTWTFVGRSYGTTLTDNGVVPGTEYIYRVRSYPASDLPSYTPNGVAPLEFSFHAGFRLPPVEYRGRVLLVTTPFYATNLVAELAEYRTNLVGDGWDVSMVTNAVRHDEYWFNTNLIAYKNAVQGVRTVITNFYYQAPTSTNVVILLGHVAIPYSGLNSDEPRPEDGHLDHAGAWSADLYYADLDGNWTDSATNNITDNPTRWNVVGDGKWDQESSFPTNSVGKMGIELGIGRIDLSRLDAFAYSTTSRLELDLTRQYLVKNTAFRNRNIQYPSRIVWQDNLGDSYLTQCLSRHTNAWFGLNASNSIVGDVFTNGLAALWGAQAGHGSFNCINHTNANEHNTTDLAGFGTAQVPQVAFYLLRGSYFAEWNIYYDQFLRACLAMTNHGLASMWVDQPYSLWNLQSLALGECLGQGLVRTVDNAAGNVSVRSVYIMGDPTLRPFVLAPPTSLMGTRSGTVTLTWTASTDPAAQYCVFRSTNATLSASSQFTKLTQVPIALTNYTDATPPSSTNTTYMVRALSMTSTGSGSFTNLSQGVFIVR